MGGELKNLKRAMKKHIFQNIEFDEKLRTGIVENISTNLEQELFLLLGEHKTATQLIQQLHVKGIKAIKENEGLVFTTLHQAEFAGDIEGVWNNAGEKLYILSKKGKKKIAQLEKVSKSLKLTSIFHEVTANES